MVAIVSSKSNTVIAIVSHADYDQNGNIETENGCKYFGNSLTIQPIDPSVEIPIDISQQPDKYYYIKENGFIRNPNYTEEVTFNTIRPYIQKLIYVDDPTLIDTSCYGEDDYRDYLYNVLSKQCENYIKDGITVFLPDAQELTHISLTEKDQIDIMLLFTSLTDNVQYVPYHADNGNCTLYTVRDFLAIYTSYRIHQLFNTTLVNQLHRYISDDITGLENLKRISYATLLPKARLDYMLNIIYVTIEALASDIDDERIEKMIRAEFESIGTDVSDIDLSNPTKR